MSSAQAQGLQAKDILSTIIEPFDPSKYADVDNAIVALSKKDLPACNQALAVAYQKNPELPPPNVMLAQILFKANQIAGGKQALEKATTETPNDPAAYVYLGQLALQRGGQAEAAAMYNKGIQLCSKYSANPKRKSVLLSSAYSGLALMEEQKENWTIAKAHLEEQLKQDADNIMARTRLGRVLFKMAKDKDGETLAYREFIKVHKIDKEKTPRPEINMALLYEQAGRRSAADSMMTKAIKNDGNNLRTRLSVAQWALDAGKMNVAQQNASAASKIDPNALNVKLLNGMIARYQRNLPGAEKAFKDAHLQSPTHMGAMSQLALTLIEDPSEDKQRQALGFAELCFRMHSDLRQPAGREAGIVYAWCIYKLGRKQEALRAVAQVVNKGPVSADGAFFAAQILHDSGQSEVAKKILEQNLKSGKSFPNRAAAERLRAQIQ